MNNTMFFVILLFLCAFHFSNSEQEQPFDVRKHLSTVSRYGVVKDIADSNFVPSNIPEGCVPIHLNLVARHGTRSPTKKRIRELDNLSVRLEVLVRDAKERNLPLERVPSWLNGWKSPWQGRRKGGELVTKGEEELYDLGIRIREKFPNLFDEEYHPDTYPIKATQVARASASAVAFGMGLFSGNGSLGPGHNRAFAVTSESRASDIVLRFHDCCHNYKLLMTDEQVSVSAPFIDKFVSPLLDSTFCLQFCLAAPFWWNFTYLNELKFPYLPHVKPIFGGMSKLFCVFKRLYEAFRKSQEPAVSKLKEPILDEITSTLIERHGLNFTRQDTSSLWFLCKQEASLLDITNQACSLFSPPEIEMLEWTDDLEAFILKGYGKSINYRMGVPLLEDVVQSMEQAIKAKEERHAPGSFEKARLRFAHAETVVPFSCLLGLFLEGSEFKTIQEEQPLQHPPKPPQKRKWRGSTVAPFAGNNMLVLYSCPAPGKSTSKHFVQVLHNEHPVPMPGCDGSDFCPFEEFKEKIVAPHWKHDFDTVCNAKLEQGSGSKVFQIFQWLFSLGKGDKYPRDEF